MKMSLVLSSASIAARPASVLRFHTTERLPRFIRMCSGPMNGVFADAPMLREASPPSGSILTTSAPRSARIWVQ